MSVPSLQVLVSNRILQEEDQGPLEKVVDFRAEAEIT